jgi:hypothetical protein
MGCDIHLHIEMKVYGNWVHYGCPSMDRNYELFVMMADVRNDGEIIPIDKPRGFPPDGVSLLTRLCYEHEKVGAHSISWLNSKEIELLTKWYDKKYSSSCKYWNHHCIKTYLCGNNITSDIKDIDDVRLVFWFDN